MSTKQQEECYTHFTHLENGKVMNRHLHQLIVQDRRGQVHTLEGRYLPQAIVTFTGQSHKGLHIGEILLGKRQYLPADVSAWPTARDAVHLGIGVIVLLLLNFFGTVVLAGG